MTPLRFLASLNPPTAAFSGHPVDRLVTFVPMEALGADGRLDVTREKNMAEIGGYQRFQENDVLLPKIAPTFQAGRSVLAQNLFGGLGAGSTDLHVLRAGKALVPSFLMYLTMAPPFLSAGEAQMHGVAGQKRVPASFLGAFDVEAPSLEQQSVITRLLDREIDAMYELRALRTRQVALAEERHAALIDVKVEEHVRIFGERPLRYAVDRVQQGIAVVGGDTPAGPGEWGVLKASSLRPGEFRPEENKRLPPPADLLRDFEIRAGDLLIARANAPSLVGSAAVVRDVRPRLLLSDKIMRVGLKPGLDPRYVSAVMASSRSRDAALIRSTGTSSSMVNLRIRDIEEWPIPCADPASQESLVMVVERSNEALRAFRNAATREMALLAERRGVLIEDVLASAGVFAPSSGHGIGDLIG